MFFGSFLYGKEGLLIFQENGLGGGNLLPCGGGHPLQRVGNVQGGSDEIRKR